MTKIRTGVATVLVGASMCVPAGAGLVTTSERAPQPVARSSWGKHDTTARSSWGSPAKVARSSWGRVQATA